MELAQLLIFISYILIFIFIVLFNWLYSARAIRATKNIGLYTPEYLKVLVKLSTGIAIGTMLLISVFLTAQLF